MPQSVPQWAKRMPAGLKCGLAGYSASNAAPILCAGTVAPKVPTDDVSTFPMRSAGSFIGKYDDTQDEKQLQGAPPNPFEVASTS